MKLPFIGGAYAGRTRSTNSQASRNFYIGVDPKDSAQISLNSTPGSSEKWDIGNGPIRGSLSTDAVVYHVSGAGLYAGTTLVGTLNTVSGTVYMAFNGTTLMIVDGEWGYTWNGAAFAVITDPDFPDNPGTLTLQDGYFIVSDIGTNQFYISSSGPSWVATDFASAEGDSDYLVRVYSDRQILWLFGSMTGEVHYNSEDADFPFRRLDGGLFHYGCAAPASVARIKGGLIWLSKNARGEGQVIAMSGGYQPEIISTPQLDYRFSTYSRIDDAVAYTYQSEGHEFYCLTFPSGNATWVFDGTSAEWHERASTIAGEFPSRQRYASHAFFGGEHLVGDYVSGKVYVLDNDLGTEYDGTTIIRDRITQHMNLDQSRLFLREVQVVMEHGVGVATGTSSQTDPQVSLRWSKDRGNTWSNELFRSIGKIGEYLTRAVWRNLGYGRDWVFWLRTYTDRPVTVVEAIGQTREAGGRRRYDSQ